MSIQSNVGGFRPRPAEAKSAAAFLARLITKLAKLETAVEGLKYREIDHLKAELVVYARHFDEKCSAVIGIESSGLDMRIASLAAMLTRDRLQGDETRNAINSEIHAVVGTLTATQEIVTELSVRKMRKVISGIVIAIGLTPALFVPEILTIGTAVVMGVLGLNGSIANIVIGIVRRSSKKIVADPETQTPSAARTDPTDPNVGA